MPVKSVVESFSIYMYFYEFDDSFTNLGFDIIMKRVLNVWYLEHSSSVSEMFRAKPKFQGAKLDKIVLRFLCHSI